MNSLPPPRKVFVTLTVRKHVIEARWFCNLRGVVIVTEHPLEQLEQLIDFWTKRRGKKVSVKYE